jgi:hypothetical protein
MYWAVKEEISYIFNVTTITDLTGKMYDSCQLSGMKLESNTDLNSEVKHRRRQGGRGLWTKKIFEIDREIPLTRIFF